MSTRVQVISQLYPGSATVQEGVFVHARMRSLPERFDIRVWRVRPTFPFRGGPRPPAEEVLDGIPVHDVPFLYLPGVLKGLDGSWMLRALRRKSTNETELLDAHFAYPAGWAATRLGQERGLPVVVSLRGTEAVYSRDAARRRRIAECLRAADRIIAVSGYLEELARDLGAPSKNVCVIGNGVDTKLFHPGPSSEVRERLGIAADARVLLTVGGLTERKGVRRVLEILPSLRGSHPDIRYIVAGGGGPEGSEERSIRSMTGRLGLADVVSLLGPLRYEELPEIYRAADVFVLSTRNEGWSNALNEALASGLRVVTTDVGGNREVLENGRTGTLVTFGDPDALREALARALEATARGEVTPEPNLRSWEQVGSEVAAVFDGVLG